MLGDCKSERIEAMITHSLHTGALLLLLLVVDTFKWSCEWDSALQTTTLTFMQWCEQSRYNCVVEFVYAAVHRATSKIIWNDGPSRNVCGSSMYVVRVYVCASERARAATDTKYTCTDTLVFHTDFRLNLVAVAAFIILFVLPHIYM